MGPYKNFIINILTFAGLAAAGFLYFKLMTLGIKEDTTRSREIIVYTIHNCPFCVKAKKLLDKKDIYYDEINVQEQPEKMEEMLKYSSGRKSFPQIFILGTHVGGCYDLYKLEEEGKLDTLLKR